MEGAQSSEAIGGKGNEERRLSLSSVLATAGAVLFALPGTLILGTLAFLLAWFPPRGHGTFFCARVWGRCLLAAAGVRVRVEVHPEIDPSQGYMFLANHMSYFDIPVLLAVLPGQVRFAAKRSLFQIPIFGWAIRAGGFIPVDRRDRSQARSVFSAASSLLRRGVSVLMFPEGTRSPDDRIHTFHRGGFLVALKAGLPIVPVGVEGARKVMPRQSFLICPGTITVRFGSPVDTRSYNLRQKDELIGRVREEVSKLSGAQLAPRPSRERQGDA